MITCRLKTILFVVDLTVSWLAIQIIERQKAIDPDMTSVKFSSSNLARQI